MMGGQIGRSICRQYLKDLDSAPNDHFAASPDGRMT